MGRLTPSGRVVAAVAALAATTALLTVPVAVPGHALSACTVGAPCPLALPDEYWLTYSTAGTALQVPAASGLLANDQGPVGTVVDTSDEIFPDMTFATVRLRGDGSFTYKPDPTDYFTGDDTFDYFIKDNQGHWGAATVTIHVVPVVTDDVFYTKVGAPVLVGAPGVLGNDLGIDPMGLYYDDASVNGGSVDVNDDGSFGYVPPAGFSGLDTFTYTVSDTNFDNEYTGTVRIFVDSTRPAASITAPTSRVTLATTVPVKWTATDTGTNPSGVKSYTVAVRKGAWNGSLGSWTTWKSATTATSASYFGNYGYTYCFRVYAIDRSGNTSPWSAPRCTAVPLRAPSYSYAGSWTSESRSDVYGGVLRKTTTPLSSASRSSARAERLYIVATKCATCGTVQVRWNNVVVGSVSLYNATTARKQVIAVKSWSSLQTGALKLVVTSPSGKLVGLEGLAVYKD